MRPSGVVRRMIVTELLRLFEPPEGRQGDLGLLARAGRLLPDLPGGHLRRSARAVALTTSLAVRFREASLSGSTQIRML